MNMSPYVGQGLISFSTCPMRVYANIVRYYDKKKEKKRKKKLYVNLSFHTTVFIFGSKI